MFFFRNKKEENIDEDIIELQQEDVTETSKEVPVEEIVVEEEIIIEEAAEEVPETETETVSVQEEVEEEPSEEDKNRPIYILGDNALACYLAIRFINAGEKVKIIANKEAASSLSNNGVTMIESHNLQKSNHKFDTTFWLKETPKMLIITSEANKLNAAITAISRKKILDAPVILFTPIRDILYIKNILENDIYRAFFEGYLLKKPNQINLFGRAPGIVITPKGNRKKDKIVFNTFKNADLIIRKQDDEIKAFWDFFTVYTACSLISAANNKTIFDVIKDKEKREQIIPLIQELCKIAKSDGAILDQEEILKKIYNTPLSYPYPLQVEISRGKAGDIDLISSNIINVARKHKEPTHQTGALLKKIYNIILA